MNATSSDNPAPPSWWRTLLMLLAVPLAISGALVAVWLARGREPLDDSFLPALSSLSMTFSALWCLRSSSARALMLPTPIMMWSLSSADRQPDSPFLGTLLGDCACMALLTACCYEKRHLARVATIVCGAATIWLRWPR